MKGPTVTPVEAKSNSSMAVAISNPERVPLKKLTSKDESILFGEKEKSKEGVAASVLAKRPRLLSSQHDKELKDLVVEHDAKDATKAVKE